MPQADCLKTDCSQCAALCCLVLAFDQGKDFAFSKNPCEPCRNLSGHLCAIHERLNEAGMPGCVAYDCLGAGNRVVQEVFAGQTWQQEPRLMRVMMEAFSAMREVHKRIDLLRAAEMFALEPQAEQNRRAFQDRLETHRWSGTELNEFEAEFALEIDMFLYAIKDHFPVDILASLKMG